MKFGLPGILCLSFFIYAEKAFTQPRSLDSTMHRSAYAHSASVYQNQQGDQSPLNNGVRYEKYPHPFRLGSAYFPSDQFTRGSVVYNGIFYDSVTLKYDDLQQFLILLKDGYEMAMINERVSSFDIGGNTFLRLMADSAHSGIPATGFYQLLYDGPSSVIKRTTKYIREETFATDGVPRYMVTDEAYYIRRGQIFMRVKTVESLPNIFSDHKKELKRFIENNNLQDDNMGDMLIRVTDYYDKLVK
jgi:hypothetical protein